MEPQANAGGHGWRASVGVPARGGFWAPVLCSVVVWGHPRMMYLHALLLGSKYRCYRGSKYRHVMWCQQRSSGASTCPSMNHSQLVRAKALAAARQHAALAVSVLCACVQTSSCSRRSESTSNSNRSPCLTGPDRYPTKFSEMCTLCSGPSHFRSVCRLTQVVKVRARRARALCCNHTDGVSADAES